MANWGGVGYSGGTKSSIIYHIIMFVLNLILSVIALGLYVFSLLDKDFRFGSLFLVILFLFVSYIHYCLIHRDISRYRNKAAYSLALKNPTKIDKLIINLVNRYYKK